MVDRVVNAIRVICLGIAALLAGCAPSHEQQVAKHTATIGKFCLDCHNDNDKTGGQQGVSPRFRRTTTHLSVPGNAETIPGFIAHIGMHAPAPKQGLACHRQGDQKRASLHPAERP